MSTSTAETTSHEFLSLTMLGIGLPLAGLRFVTPPRQPSIADQA